MTYHQTVFEKIQFLGRIYVSNTDSNTRNFEELRIWSQRGEMFAKFAFIPISLTSSMFVFWAVGAFAWTGEKELILYIMLPGVSETDTIGFIVLSLYHLAGLLLVVFGTCGADCMLVVFVFHLWPLSNIIQNMCNELNAALEEQSNRNTPELRRFFYNLVQMHKEVCEYLEDISDVYFYMVFVEIYTCGITLCTLLYCMFTVPFNLLLFNN